MAAMFPAFQRMISRDDSATILRRHADHLRHYNATDADCHIERLEETNAFDKSQGFQCNYELHWTTYLGWKVYMLHTGCFASDPAFEPSLSCSHGGTYILPIDE